MKRLNLNEKIMPSMENECKQKWRNGQPGRLGTDL